MRTYLKRDVDMESGVPFLGKCEPSYSLYAGDRVSAQYQIHISLCDGSLEDEI